MGFCTSLFLPNGIETEVLPAPITELKGVFIQNSVADFTVLDLHRFVLEERGERSEAKSFHLLTGGGVFPQTLCLTLILWGKLRDLMGGIKGFVKGSHGILYLFCLNDTGAAGDRGADG